MYRLADAVLGLGFLVVAGAKFHRGHSEDLYLGSGAYYSVATLESVLGIMLIAAWRRVDALLAVVVLAAIGMVVHGLGVSQGKRCGCMGNVNLSEYQEYFALGIAGLIAVWSLDGVLRSRNARSSEAK